MKNARTQSRRKGKKGNGKKKERETEDKGEEERRRNSAVELGAAGELLSQRKKGEANVTHEGEGGAAVEPRPVAVVRASPLSFAEGETQREDADLHHRASLLSSRLHHCRTLFPLPSGDAAEEESFLCRCCYRKSWLLPSFMLKLVTGKDKLLRHPLRSNTEPPVL
ncbi:hypothetical protein Ahy_A03g011640 isoform A [Arachis hypogaea]|uniref:Uncharacterized protein n=1 Tax=Arachis hypogaea TaxID=3818 RepID=A0A445DRB4_ARAHY|nr:hypothetical protein Ahy_A03g011640 isoform A [Arachis hypogaea]